MAAEEPPPATVGSLTCVPPPLDLPPAVKTRPAGRGIRFRRSSRNLDTASEQPSRETELEPAAEGQAATAEGAAAGQSPCGGSGTARRRRGAGGASPATPGEEDFHHRLSDAHIAYFEDQERLFRQRPQLDGKSRAVTDGRRASSRVLLRESLESGDQIDLGYYDPAARHYAWVKYAHQTGDWRMRLQLFLEDWQSSPGAFVFTLTVTLAIVAQVILMMVATNSFGADRLNECAIWVLSWVLTGFFTIELVLRTVSKRSCKEMCFSAYWWIDLVSVLPDYVALVLATAAGYELDRCAMADDDSDDDDVIETLRAFLRVFRVVRILKIARLNPDTTVLYRAIRLSTRALAVPFTFLLIGAFFFGAIIYYLEHIELEVLAGGNATEGGSPYNDLGEAIWCMIVTFTTVGYGDVSPEGHLGKMVCSLAIFAGVVLIAMPLAIVGNNFVIAWEERATMAFVLQVQRTCIDRNISLLGIQKLFEDADTHGSGYLDYLEFRVFCEELGLEYTPSEARRLFRLFDEGKTGGITFFEYCHTIFPDLDVEWLYDRGVVGVGLGGASGAASDTYPRMSAKPASQHGRHSAGGCSAGHSREASSGAPSLVSPPRRLSPHRSPKLRRDYSPPRDAGSPAGRVAVGSPPARGVPPLPGWAPKGYGPPPPPGMSSPKGLGGERVGWGGLRGGGVGTRNRATAIMKQASRTELRGGGSMAGGSSMSGSRDERSWHGACGLRPPHHHGRHLDRFPAAPVRASKTTPNLPRLPAPLPRHHRSASSVFARPDAPASCCAAGADLPAALAGALAEEASDPTSPQQRRRAEEQWLHPRSPLATAAERGWERGGGGGGPAIEASQLAATQQQVQVQRQQQAQMQQQQAQMLALVRRLDAQQAALALALERIERQLGTARADERPMIQRAAPERSSAASSSSSSDEDEQPFLLR